MRAYPYVVFETKMIKILWLILLPFSGFAQNPANLLPVFKAPLAAKISFQEVLTHIRKIKNDAPEYYGDEVDYYYLILLKRGQNERILKLEEFSLDLDCLAQLKNKINAHIQSIRSLEVGEKVPEISLPNFKLSSFHPQPSQILLLFYSPSCFHCTELIIDLLPFTSKMDLSVIAIQVDKETNPWIFPDHWVQIKATEKMRRDYGVYSTPTLFLINSTSHQITGIPENMNQLKSMEHLMKKEN